MKIRNSGLRDYNSEDLEELVNGCSKIGELSYDLMGNGHEIASDIACCCEFIDTVNFTAAKKMMISYLSFSAKCFDELSELEASAVDYANVLGSKWHSGGFSINMYENKSFNYSLLEGGTTDSNKGRVTDVDVLNRLILLADDFYYKAIDSINEIKKESAALQDVWHDSQYNEFIDFIEEITQKLKSNAESIDSFIHSIKEEIKE